MKTSVKLYVIGLVLIVIAFSAVIGIAILADRANIKSNTHVEYVTPEKYEKECATKTFAERGYYCKGLGGISY